MLLAAPPHLLRQLLCPSQHFIHSLLTSLHSTSFAAKHFASVFGCTLPFTLSLAKCADTNTFAKPTLQYSLGSITLRSSLLHFSTTQSTRCPLFGSPASPLSAALSLRILIAQLVPRIRKVSLSFACIVQPPPFE
jgi:hypothetical protein